MIDASLYPFSGWRDLGLAPFDYLFAAWPAHALAFDMLVNALGYLPLGFACGLALHPRLRGAGMVGAVTLPCAVLSIGLEALQTYLPARVASKVDVLTNVAGGFVGALIAARFAHALLDTGRLRMWRARWFVADASHGLILAAVWFAALVYPDAFVFGTGGLLKAFDPSVADRIAAAVGFADQGDPVATAVRFQIAEATVTALTLLGAGLLVLNLLRKGLRWSARFLLLVLFVLATVSVEGVAHAFLFNDATVWPLLTPGARQGLTAASAALAIATMLPPRVRWALGVASLLGALALVNVYPDNPYANPVGSAWTRGKLLNFYGLASGLNLVWPYLAVAYLLGHRRSSPKRAVASPKRSTVAPSL